MTSDDEKLRKAIVRALDTLLQRRDPVEDLAGMLDSLRAQLRRVMTAAPISGSVVEAVAVRARLAALCDDEIRKLEARLRAGRLPSRGTKGAADEG